MKIIIENDNKKIVKHNTVLTSLKRMIEKGYAAACSSLASDNTGKTKYHLKMIPMHRRYA